MDVTAWMIRQEESVALVWLLQERMENSETTSSYITFMAFHIYPFTHSSRHTDVLLNSLHVSNPAQSQTRRHESEQKKRTHHLTCRSRAEQCIPSVIYSVHSIHPARHFDEIAIPSIGTLFRTTWVKHFDVCMSTAC